MAARCGWNRSSVKGAGFMCPYECDTLLLKSLGNFVKVISCLLHPLQRASMIYKHRPPQRAVTLLISLFILLFSCGISFASHLNDSSQPAAVSPVVSSASEYDYPPYCTVTPDGQADGFSVELLQAALKAMGHDVSFEVGPWAQVKQLLVDGKVQVLPLVGRTPEREHDYDFTFPYLKMHGTIVVRKGENGIRGLADLKGEQIAVLKGDNAEEFLRRSNLGATIVTTTTFDEALRQLHNGEHDAVVVQKLVALQLIRKHDLTNLKTVGPPLEDFVQSFCFAVKKGTTGCSICSMKGCRSPLPMALSSLYTKNGSDRLKHSHSLRVGLSLVVMTTILRMNSSMRTASRPATMST